MDWTCCNSATGSSQQNVERYFIGFQVISRRNASYRKGVHLWTGCGVAGALHSLSSYVACGDKWHMANGRKIAALATHQMICSGWREVSVLTEGSYSVHSGVMFQEPATWTHVHTRCSRQVPAVFSGFVEIVSGTLPIQLPSSGGVMEHFLTVSAQWNLRKNTVSLERAGGCWFHMRVIHDESIAPTRFG